MMEACHHQRDLISYMTMLRDIIMCSLTCQVLWQNGMCALHVIKDVKKLLHMFVSTRAATACPSHRVRARNDTRVTTNGISGVERVSTSIRNWPGKRKLKKRVRNVWYADTEKARML